ncbi:MAG: NIPSNAP family protein [Burkholderiaceae bacterium]
MAIYELRTYTVVVGKMAEVSELYKTEGFPALKAIDTDQCLVGYFTGDIGAMNQLFHLWKFEDDAARRAFWARVYASDDFMAFAAKLRPRLVSQQNQLMMSAPWGPTV